MNFRNGLLALTLVASMQQFSHASPPSPNQLEAWKAHETELKVSLEKAEPWKDCLTKTFLGESPEVVGFIFLATFKHGFSGTDSSAEAFFKVWKTAKKKCLKAKLEPKDLAEAIYRFTNSDWAPVSITKGPGLDQLITPKDFSMWADAVIAVGKKAAKKKMSPGTVWFNMAASYQVRNPEDLAKTALDIAPPRF